MRKDVVIWTISGLRIGEPEPNTEVVEDQPPESTTATADGGQQKRRVVDILPKMMRPDTGVFG